MITEDKMNVLSGLNAAEALGVVLSPIASRTMKDNAKEIVLSKLDPDIRRIANLFSGNLDDYVAVGRVGALQAMQTFKGDANSAFDTFRCWAFPFIVEEIARTAFIVDEIVRESKEQNR